MCVFGKGLGAGECGLWIPDLKGVNCEPYRKKGGYRYRIGEVNGNG